MICLLCASSAFAQTETPATASASNTNEAALIAAAQLESLRQLQAQQEATLKSLEITRADIASSLATSLSNNMVQLKAMTDVLTLQRAQDMKVIRDSNRLVLAVVVGLTGLLLLSIIFLNVTSIRAINRLTTVFSANSFLPPTDESLSLEAKARQKQLLLFPGEEGQRQLGSALIQLQTRIQALESLSTKPRATETAPIAGATK